tara:strand:+ start:1265 stop:1597 length:333 start_codon:yes stop_codon:yes gene_type:complete
MNYTFTFLTEVELHNAKIYLQELAEEVKKSRNTIPTHLLQEVKKGWIPTDIKYKEERIERIKNDIEFTKAVLSIDLAHCEKHNIDFERFNKCRTHHDESMGKIDPQYKLS